MGGFKRENSSKISSSSFLIFLTPLRYHTIFVTVTLLVEGGLTHNAIVINSSLTAFKVLSKIIVMPPF